MGKLELISNHSLDMNKIRLKENSWIAKIAARKLKSKDVAIVLGKTIHLHKISKEEFLDNKKWVKHEGCHIRQFENNGYVLFILKYLWESIRYGYHNNKYEKEARFAEED